MSISGCQCPLTIALANGALEGTTLYTGDMQGTYQLYKMINGKPSWKKGIHAIWSYTHESSNYWAIGLMSKIGTSWKSMHSLPNVNVDCPQQIPSNQWGYFDTNEWQTAGPNDVSVQCGKKE